MIIFSPASMIYNDSIFYIADIYFKLNYLQEAFLQQCTTSIILMIYVFTKRSFTIILRLIHTERHNVTLTGGTFDLFDGNCDGQNGLHTHLPMNVAFDGDVDMTESLGVNKALWCLAVRRFSPCTVLCILWFCFYAVQFREQN